MRLTPRAFRQILNKSISVWVSYENSKLLLDGLDLDLKVGTITPLSGRLALENRLLLVCCLGFMTLIRIDYH